MQCPVSSCLNFYLEATTSQKSDVPLLIGFRDRFLFYLMGIVYRRPLDSDSRGMSTPLIEFFLHSSLIPNGTDLI